MVCSENRYLLKIAWSRLLKCPGPSQRQGMLSECCDPTTIISHPQHPRHEERQDTAVEPFYTLLVSTGLVPSDFCFLQNSSATILVPGIILANSRSWSRHRTAGRLAVGFGGCCRRERRVAHWAPPLRASTRCRVMPPVSIPYSFRVFSSPLHDSAPVSLLHCLLRLPWLALRV